MVVAAPEREPEGGVEKKKNKEIEITRGRERQRLWLLEIQMEELANGSFLEVSRRKRR